MACGASGSRLFVQMLGAGFDAQIVHRLPLGLKRAIGRGAYVAQTLRELVRYAFPRIRLRIDGAETESGSVIVSKGQFYGGRYRLAPGATPTNRGFTVALFDCAGPAHALLYGAALPLDMMPRMPGLRLLRAQSVEIVSPAVPAQADGDPAGAEPLVITDAPTPMHVVVY
jgi:diacylglycerol kinase family enzyme